MNVKLIRMWSGEDVVADLIGEKTLLSSVILLLLFLLVRVRWDCSWSLLKEKGEELEVTKNYVVYIADTQEQIIEQYESIISVIQTPSKKLVL